MNSKHRKTLQLIFSNSVNGSAVTFILNNKRVDFHRPHPNKEALRYRVKIAREFLKKAGITYEHDEI